jgi:aminopeptidase N
LVRGKGHVPGLRAREGGVLVRAGHTEGSVDLARLAGFVGNYLVLLCTLFLPLSLYAEAPFAFKSTPGKLPKDVVPQSYDIQLKPDIEKLTFTGSERVALTVRKPVKTLTLNVNAMTIGSAKLRRAGDQTEQAAVVAINAKEQTATLSLSKKIAAGTYELWLDFAGVINQTGQGLFDATYQEEGTGAKKTLLGTQV